MLSNHQDGRPHRTWWVFLWKVLEGVFLITAVVLVFTQGRMIHLLETQYPTAASLAGWGIGMLSYHQDSRYHIVGSAILSQIFAFVCLTALVVLGFTHRSWANFVVALPVIWMHVEFTKRWWKRPGAWW